MPGSFSVCLSRRLILPGHGSVRPRVLRVVVLPIAEVHSTVGCVGHGRIFGLCLPRLLDSSSLRLVAFLLCVYQGF